MNNKLDKPPLGLIPKKIHDENRHKEIIKAMYRYFDEYRPIPTEWVDEYNEILQRLAK